MSPTSDPTGLCMKYRQPDLFIWIRQFALGYHQRHLSTRLREEQTRFFRLMAVLSVLVSSQGIVCEEAIATPPQVVYRIDERPPDAIFKQGFTANGRNDYLLAHVLGASLVRGLPENQRSNFVATTATLQTAYLIAERRWQFNPALRTRPLFIYEIRADQNFYEVDR